MDTNLDQWLQEGITAAKAGQAEAAQECLLRVIDQDAYNETAWLWLSSVVKSEDDQRVCLENVLTVNPNNDNARARLAMLAASPQITFTPSPQPEVASPGEQAAYPTIALPQSPISAPAGAGWADEDSLGCPYCGRDTQPDDTVCPHCRQRLVFQGPPKDSRPGTMRFLSSAWLMTAAVYTIINFMTVSILLVALAGRAKSGASPLSGYLTDVISSFIINVSPRAGLSSTNLMALMWFFVAGELIVTAWSLVIAAIVPSRHNSASLLAMLVATLSVFLFTAELIFGIYTSLIKLVASLAVGYWLIRSLGEFQLETMRHTLALDHGLKSALDYYNRGRRYRQQGMLAKAILHWERAVALEPDRGALHIPLGNALYAAGRYREATGHIQAALRSDPANEDLRRFLEHIQARLNAQVNTMS